MTPQDLHTFFVSSDDELRSIAGRMVESALALPAGEIPQYSSGPVETKAKLAALGGPAVVTAVTSSLGVAARFSFYPELSFLTFTVGISKEVRPEGLCLHLSVSARGLVDVVESPPEEALLRLARAFSPQMERCPPEGGLSFVHHFRSSLPSS